MAKAKHTTRRAPHMEPYVKVVKRYDRKYNVDLVVGNQRFQVNWSKEGLTKKLAEWHRDMLCIALDKVVRDHEGKQLPAAAE